MNRAGRGVPSVLTLSPRPMTRLSPRTLRSAVALALGLGAAWAAAAQPAALDARLDRLSERLSLTAEQAAALDAIAARQDAAGPGALWAVAAEVRQVLTADQIAQLRQARRARRGGRMSPGRNAQGRAHRGETRRDRRAEAPAGAQRDALRAIRDDARARRQSLVDRLRAGEITDAAFADEMRALRADVARRVAAARPDGAERGSNREARRQAARAAREAALGLTADQRARLLALRLDAVREAPERPDLRPYLDADGRLDREAYRDAAEARRRAHREAAQARRQRAADVLTADQRDLVTVYGALAAGRRMGGRR